MPAYISYISGVSVKELQEGNTAKYRLKILTSSLIYIFGFSLVFIVLGASASFAGSLFAQNRELVQRAGGVLVIILGAWMAGIVPVSFLNRKRSFQLPENLRHLPFVTPFLMGITFAAAWTPCVGAVLGAILLLAATQGTLGQGVLLLAVYAAGLAIPFLVVSLFISSIGRFLMKMGPVLEKIQKAGGFLLVILGILLVTDKFVILTGFFFRLFYAFGFKPLL
ncbi:sulfite exporter TauE/SafE family protein [Candidatus Curtissbacteria bacterium]|nr:sulfite exporter TauE/SafE family protein [Candidatus Curtissbacteria bacterium]